MEPSEITKAIEELTQYFAEAMTPAAQAVWMAALKYNFALAATSIGLALLMFVLTVGLIIAARLFVKLAVFGSAEGEPEKEIGGYFGGVFSLVCSIVTFIVACVYAYTGVIRLLAPEWSAAKDILDSMPF